MMSRGSDVGATAGADAATSPGVDLGAAGAVGDGRLDGLRGELERASTAVGDDSGQVERDVQLVALDDGLAHLGQLVDGTGDRFAVVDADTGQAEGLDDEAVLGLDPGGDRLLD